MLTEPDKALQQQIISALGLNKVKAGDQRCRAVRIEAAEKLIATVIRFHRQGHSIIYPPPYAMRHFEFIKEVALYGDIGMADIASTYSAIEYMVGKLIEAFPMNEEDRRNLFNEALRNLVATHPLFKIQ